MAQHAYFHGKRVSKSHKIMLDEAQRRGLVSYINQGRRTLAEQAAFYAHYLRYGHPLAARPWGGAPHIKWGAENHALDINDGVVDRVAAFYRSQGVPVAFNVRGEPWHMDTLSEQKLIAAARRIDKNTYRTIKFGMRDPDVVTAKRWLYKLGIFKSKRRSKRFGALLRTAVKRFQKRNGLKADGVIGPKTWKLLYKRTH